MRVHVGEGEVSERNREGCSHVTLYIWNSEDNFLESVLSFLVGVREQNHVLRCGYKSACGLRLTGNFVLLHIILLLN